MEKTVGLLLIIGLGLLLQTKIKSKEQLKGIKLLILSIALPATIFVALLNVRLTPELLLLPLAALILNFVFLGVFHLVLKQYGHISSRNRTMLMLMPSLAPGLSCFPFIAEYLGDEPLAMAAMADVGNKFFVLIFLYTLAMKWYYGKKQVGDQLNKSSVKELIVSLLNEPINIVMLLAFALLAFDINLHTLPTFISIPVERLSAIMAPLVLLFIGMAVKIRKQEVTFLLQMLSLRAGIAFCLAAAVIYLLPGISVSMALLILVFGQSSCSFWPFAHMSVVNELEMNTKRKTFDVDMAISVLALSLPFSTFIILGILSFPQIANYPIYIFGIGFLLILAHMIPATVSKFKRTELSPSAQ
ncbi:MAG: permease [Cyclobacteriaceae bacterium]